MKTSVVSNSLLYVTVTKDVKQSFRSAKSKGRVRRVGERMSPESVDSSFGAKEVVKFGCRLPTAPQLSAALRELKMTYTEGDTLCAVSVP